MSVEATPTNCIRILIAGVVTTEMRERLTRMALGKIFLLDDSVEDGEPWQEFLVEVFNYTLRITDPIFATPEWSCGGTGSCPGKVTAIDGTLDATRRIFVHM